MSAVPERTNLGIPVPPWLWLWVALFLANLPERLSAAADQVRSMLEGERRLAEVGIGVFVEPGGWLKLGAYVLPLAVELLPPLALAAGLAYAAFPRRRARDIERADALTPPDPDYPNPALAELRAFLERHAPGIEHRVNLSASQKVVRVFARRPFRSVAGIYGGALRIWRKDREIGEAILLHELAHHRQGDAALLGTGEPLPWAIRTAPLLFLAFVIAPVVVAALQQAVVHAQSIADLARPLATAGLDEERLAALPPAPGFWAAAADSLRNALTVSAPAIPLLVVQAAAWVAAAFILPVTAIWCSELNADRFAELHRPGALARWLAGLTPIRQPWYRRALGVLAHPPLKLRVWLARDAGSPWALALLLLLFPAAYLARLAAMLVWAVGAHLTSGQSAAELPERMAAWTAGYAGSVAPVLLAVGAITLAWPELARLWERGLAGVDARLPRGDLPVYRRVGAGVAAVGLLGWLLTRG